MVAAPLSADTLAQHSASNPSLRIKIVGGGIGGLACALACARLGFTDVVVYENAPQIAEVRPRLSSPFSRLFLIQLFEVPNRLEQGFK